MLNKKILKNMFTLEGIDGSGKTTQAPLIKEYLKKAGLKVQVFRHPDINPLGEFIRKNIRTFDPWLRNQLIVLDMKATLRNQEKNYDLKTIFIWDRYIDSFYTSNSEMTLKEANDIMSEMPLPIKTFWLDIDPNVVLTQRENAVNEHSDPIWLSLKQKRYNKLFKK